MTPKLKRKDHNLFFTRPLIKTSTSLLGNKYLKISMLEYF
jgi:hypothetical protein